MEHKKKEHFDLNLDSLRSLGRWAAECAEHALSLYEEACDPDPRPRAALEGIRLFANGGPRTQHLRFLAMDAFRAAHNTSNLAASAAAQAASLAAASAFTHPLRDVLQTKHILGPAAYAALAIEIQNHNDPTCGDTEVAWAVEHAPPEVCDLLREMPPRTLGKGRLDRLMHELDGGIRKKA